jgi:hypothetical protein
MIKTIVYIFFGNYFPIKEHSISKIETKKEAILIYPCELHYNLGKKTDKNKKQEKNLCINQFIVTNFRGIESINEKPKDKKIKNLEPLEKIDKLNSKRFINDFSSVDDLIKEEDNDFDGEVVRDLDSLESDCDGFVELHWGIYILVLSLVALPTICYLFWKLYLRIGLIRNFFDFFYNCYVNFIYLACLVCGFFNAWADQIIKMFYLREETPSNVSSPKSEEIKMVIIEIPEATYK